ncbi:hypothetical protein PV05_07045 [Exophiala xenobiotica]|uniref:Swi5-dependent recombination DNA repair protein 1 n=1 Tax=Exophiala xenobiotica TaxID=348802 RepID=A0A0D2EJ47_9EURO|nr:uncharacterized protein PV05_07045 [Exophiala xenobiotica]KIW54700.1 hypothetical protein PV05_07045 [Exophiala xenobiotica]
MMHPAKRRRLDQSTASLTKPFRSPLRKDPSDPSHKPNITSPDTKLHLDTKLSPLVTTSIDSAETTKKPHGSASTGFAGTANAEHRELQKEHVALTLHLKKLCQSLDVAQQALQIETSNQIVQLQVLISKWKAVARDVAEQLFDEAKERIDHMGGFKAWQHRAQDDARLWNKDEKTTHHYPDDRRDENDSQPEIATADKDNFDAANHSSNEEEEPDTFTMETMLREMNIDLQLIGYDKESEGWLV